MSRIKIKSILTILLSIFCVNINAQVIKGRVSDSTTREPLSYAAVEIRSFGDDTYITGGSTTAHAKYALDGFNLDAVDFLHKPIAYERFERAVEKAMLHIKANEDETTHDVIQDTIVVKQDYSSVNIPISDIFYIEALENYSKIFRLNGGTIISRLNIKAIHKMLPQKQFIRVHRSFVVPVNKIQQFSKQEIHLIGLNKPIPVGRSYAKEVSEILLQND